MTLGDDGVGYPLCATHAYQARLVGWVFPFLLHVPHSTLIQRSNIRARKGGRVEGACVFGYINVCGISLPFLLTALVVFFSYERERNSPSVFIDGSIEVQRYHG